MMTSVVSVLLETRRSVQVVTGGQFLHAESDLKDDEDYEE